MYPERLSSVSLSALASLRNPVLVETGDAHEPPVRESAWYRVSDETLEALVSLALEKVSSCRKLRHVV